MTVKSMTVMTLLILVLSLFSCQKTSPIDGTKGNKKNESESSLETGEKSAENGTQIENNGSEEPDTGKSDDNAEYSLLSYRQMLEEGEDICAVAFLGYYDGSYADLKDYFASTDTDDAFNFVKDIPESHFVTSGGTELYLIIPRADVEGVIINEWIMNESNGYYGEEGGELYRSDDGEPVLLRCNVSDVMPDTVLKLTEGKSTMLHSLQMSLYDGSLCVPTTVPGILDLTNYDAVYGNYEEYTYDDYIRDSIKHENLVGVAYISGGFEGGYEDLKREFIKSGAILDQSYVNDIPKERFVDAGGYELYVIYPGSRDATLTVNEWIIDDSNGYAGESGKTIYQSQSGEPILLKCNYSDIMPNVQVNVTDTQGTVTFYPGLSGEDGEVILPNGGGVMDMSVYRAFVPEGMEMEAYKGSYYGYIIPYDENLPSTTIYLGLWDNGECQFGFGIYDDTDDSYTEHYTGTYSFDSEAYCYDFDLTLEEGTMQVEEIHTSQYIVADAYNEEVLQMVYYDGDHLTPSNYMYSVYLYPAEG